MREKEYKPITKKFIEQFLLEAQSHSGLPIVNKISAMYVDALKFIAVPDDLLDSVMDQFLNNYMMTVHMVYNRTKKWKSYDW